ncbi:hypothetical protein [Roseateles terrae]|uniref:Uncharacterized protein n=1 Tax=Roseateles terrae TaxID=431060 RepID=A0ABR6GZU0_9BURK|nr:hypothetical protein [Roseateles terrae]MBB3196754.1 hypothetical protein [Roseateles terrae]OWQ84989.1 hypothetical protein CDN98_18270 [Roseateles terrae]
MTTPSVAPITVKTGTVAPLDPALNQCKELASQNKKARDDVKNQLNAQKNANGGSLNQADAATLAKAEGSGMTFSSAFSQVPGTEGMITACSSGIAQGKSPDLIVEGGTVEQKGGLSKKIRTDCDSAHDEAKEVAGVLCDKSHVHPGGGAGAHAEPKIVNHLTNLVGAEKMKGGSLLFNIDWQSAKYGPSGMPCQHCFAMLCHAAQECEIRIFICSHDHQPVELSKDDCKDDDAYTNLCKRVDGGPRPGR